MGRICLRSLLLAGLGLLVSVVASCSNGGTPDIVEVAVVTKTPRPGSPTPEAPTATSTSAPMPTSTSTATPTATPTLVPGAVRLREADAMVQVWVPPGTFEMGSEEARPIHRVTLDGFWMDRTEVTNVQFEHCVAAGLCEAPLTCDYGTPTYNVRGTDNQPVVCVNWENAAAYCAWMDARLPTEAEWEYAARGPNGSVYPWGDAFACNLGNFDDERQLDPEVVPGGPNCDGYAAAAPVGSFPEGASWIGALDLAGNVWEWVSDWYEPYPAEAQTNPTGPATGTERGVRGGSWHFEGRIVSSAFRYWHAPEGGNVFVGFRCACSESPAP